MTLELRTVAIAKIGAETMLTNEIIEMLRASNWSFIVVLLVMGNRSLVIGYWGDRDFTSAAKSSYRRSAVTVT